MDGLILVHKPEKITSHDVVDRIRVILGIKKVGHFGTLDPFATGLIIIAVGKATRLFPFYLKTNKAYSAQIKMGQATDTYDRTGQPLSAAQPAGHCSHSAGPAWHGPSAGDGRSFTGVTKEWRLTAR